MSADSFVPEFLRRLLRNPASSRDKSELDFLNCRLQSIDKMLAEPNLAPENRTILEKMRSEIEQEIGTS